MADPKSDPVQKNIDTQTGPSPVPTKAPTIPAPQPKPVYPGRVPGKGK
jgi:hypothetical protein